MLAAIQILAVVAGTLSALLSVLLLLRLRWPAPALWFLKLYVSALSPIFGFIGVLCMMVALMTGSVFIAFTGAYVFLFYAIHIFRITRPPDSSAGFEQAFGIRSGSLIKYGYKNYFLPRRTILKLPSVPEPRVEQNIPFATIPDTDRKLLADVWQPNTSISSSGLGFIYLHGGAWYLLDKDLGTRPLFRHLAAQGHVIMDVAYRLSPETDMMGMVNDVKRAIVWLKSNAHRYGIHPHRIVVGGGSSGAHLALMAAYTSNNSLFTPVELEEKDTSVSAVISMYGPSDLEAMYYHTLQHLTTRTTPGRPKKAVPTRLPAWMIKSMGDDFHRLGFDKGFVNAGAFAPLLGGHPDECAETYAFFSPVTHVYTHCPPTLLIHGEHDIMAPVSATRSLHERLREEKIPVVLHILPQTDHAFDLQLPIISPSAHNAIYDIERFLTLTGRKENAKDHRATNFQHAEQKIETHYYQHG